MKLTKEEIKTVASLHKDLGKLVKEGLGERFIYELISNNESSKIIPFNKELVVPTVLDKALTDKSLDEENQIIFM